jgi:signal transduction histidine kinase
MRSRLPVIYVDPVLIEQVLVNLLKNAAEAMAEAHPNAVDPVIRVLVERDGGYVCISVVDQGPGVDEATAERLFEPFYSTKSDGMGMGLNICRSIIESHRGRLWVVNNVEMDGHISGATFHCNLPIGEADGSRSRSDTPTPQTVTGEP